MNKVLSKQYHYIRYCLDADNISSTIIDQMIAHHGHRNILLHLPLSIAGINALGSISHKFPTIAATAVIPALCRFLLDPTSVLVKLSHEKAVHLSIN
jgi:hypothetical protein